MLLIHFETWMGHDSIDSVSCFCFAQIKNWNRNMIWTPVSDSGKSNVPKPFLKFFKGYFYLLKRRIQGCRGVKLVGKYIEITVPITILAKSGELGPSLHWPRQLYGLRHGKICLRKYVDSDGPDQPAHLFIAVKGHSFYNLFIFITAGAGAVWRP